MKLNVNKRFYLKEGKILVDKQTGRSALLKGESLTFVKHGLKHSDTVSFYVYCQKVANQF